MTSRQEGAVAYLVLNRPAKLNAITPEMMLQLSSLLNRLADDNMIRVIVIGGEGRAFCGGFDLSAFRTAGSPNNILTLVRRLQDLNDRIESLPKPVIASIQGYALGGGLEIALACDFRFASASSSVGQTEVNLGFIPGAGGTQRLTRLVGPARAKKMIFTGERIAASDALAIGLVDGVFEDSRLAVGVASFASLLAEKPPLALAAAKRAIGEATHPIRAGQDLEAARFALLFSSEDVREGLSAFFEKRRARFTGT